MFKIIVLEVTADEAAADDLAGIKRYEQTVDALDLPAVMAAVNRKPRKPRVKKETAAV